MKNSAFRVGVVVALGVLPAMGAVQARPTVLPGFESSTYTAGVGSQTAMAFAPDGRLFVAQQGGALRVIKNGALQAAPFTTFAPATIDSGGERGLLGVAFDPDFVTNNFVYVYHTVADGAARFNRVSRFTANGDVAVPGSETVLMDLDPLSGATNHNGGAIHFGADNKLYVAVGDNALRANAQTLNNRLGKVLRINSDGTIPVDNPFFNTATGANRSIYALGLRNPFTFGVEPGTGKTYINDVGEVSFEEINVLSAGANYGWGSNTGANEGAFDPAAFPAYTPPLVSYGHGGGTELGFSIAGGAFYNPVVNSFGAAYAGDYFYGDFVNGWIRKVDAGTGNTSLFASGLGNISDIRVADDGAVLYTNRSNGTIGRISAIAVIPEASTPALLALPAFALFINRRSRIR